MLQMANTDEKLAQLIDARKAEGIQFLVCQNTLDSATWIGTRSMASNKKISCQAVWPSWLGCS